jgi:hypothetical protein
VINVVATAITARIVNIRAERTPEALPMLDHQPGQAPSVHEHAQTLSCANILHNLLVTYTPRTFPALAVTVTSAVIHSSRTPKPRTLIDSGWFHLLINRLASRHAAVTRAGPRSTYVVAHSALTVDVDCMRYLISH